jgi:predicted Zn-dependent peptidase
MVMPERHRMMSLVVPAVAVGCACVLSFSQPSSPLAFRLSNGLLLLIDEAASTSRLEVTTAYLAGYRDEPDSARGVAHLLEHLAMRETRGGLSLAVAFAGKGIEVAATTGGDATVFSETGSASAATLETILSFERLRMTDLAITADAVEVEKRRVAIEVGGRDDPQPWRERLFGSHRLGRVSSHKDLDRIDRVTLQQFYSTYYTPSNCVIVVAPASVTPPDVRRLVEAEFASVPAGAPLQRPALRDKMQLVPRWWSAVDSPEVADGTVAAMSVPGLQHADRLALERDVNAVARSLETTLPATTGGRLSVALSDEAPAAVLRLRASRTDPSLAQAQVEAFMTALSVAILGPTDHRDVAAVGSAKTSARPSWIDCESAGDWRYCLDIDEARRMGVSIGPTTTLGRYVRAARADTAAEVPDGVDVLWPAPPRTPAAPVAPVARGAATPAAPWSPPDARDLRWRRARGGIEWTAAPGGAGDTVYVGAWVTLPPGSVALRDITALELWARTWLALRLPSGDRLEAAAAAVGVSVRVRSLPYPPLATTDRFRALGIQPTPLGGVGLEILASTPRRSAAQAVRLLAEALASGVPEQDAGVAERERQLGLLRAAIGAVPFEAEIAFRQAVPLLAPDAGPAFRPARLGDQIASMERSTPADVVAIAKRVGLEGKVRLVILGAYPAEAEAWIMGTPWERMAGTERIRAVVGCPASQPRETRLTGAKSSADLYLGLCVPVAAETGVPPAVQLVNALLGGREDALLATRLRMETGLAYAFESRVIPDAGGHGTLWYLHLTTAAGKVDEAIAEVRAVLDRAASGGVDPGRIASFREWLAQQRVERAKDGFAWLSAVLSTGLAPEQEAVAIRATSDAEANALLRAWWRPARLAITATTR